MKPNLDIIVFVLIWYSAISLMFLFACLLERILLFLIKHNLIRIKCLEDKHIRQDLTE